VTHYKTNKTKKHNTQNTQKKINKQHGPQPGAREG